MDNNMTDQNTPLQQDGAGIISSRSSAPAQAAEQAAAPYYTRAAYLEHESNQRISGNIDADDEQTTGGDDTAPARHDDAAARRAAQDAAQAKQHADLLASRSESATKQLEKLRNDPKSDLYSTDPAKQKKAMQTVRALMAQEEAEEQPDRRSMMSVDDARSEYGLSAPEIRVESMKADWNETHEMNFYDHAHARGWDSGLVQDMMSHYMKAAQGTMGEITPELIEDFHRTFATRLPKEDRDLLVRFITEEVRGGRQP